MAPALCLEGFHLQHRRKSEAEPEGPGAEEMELRVQGDWSSQHRALGRGERRGRLGDLQSMLQSADQHMGVGKPPKWKQPKGGWCMELTSTWGSPVPTSQTRKTL